MSIFSNHRKAIFSAVVIFLLLTPSIGNILAPLASADDNPSVPSDAPSTDAYQPTVEPQNLNLLRESIPAQVIIQFAPNTNAKERAAYIQSVGGIIVKEINSLDTVVVSVSDDVAQAPLPESPMVAETEPDYYVSALDDVIPNDPRYAEQWALPAIGAPSAWAHMPGDAPKVTVAVIDSGICADHPDLSGRILDGWDFLESDAVPQDDFGHGCSVAGVIAANMNDGIGIAGVAPNAQIMPLRVLNASGVGSYSDVAAAIVYAADHGARIINLSLGGSNPSSILENAVSYATSKGVIVVAAAGNNGTEDVLYPAAYADVIAVGSVDPDLQHSSFSNYGPQIDIWAPGRDILTTKLNGNYGFMSGTSFAAPYVAGAEAIELILGNQLSLNSGILLLLQNATEIQTPTGTVVVTPTAITLPSTPSDEILPRPLSEDEKNSLSIAVNQSIRFQGDAIHFDFALSEIIGEWVEINIWLLDSDGQIIPMTPVTAFGHQTGTLSWEIIGPWNPSYNDVLSNLPSNMIPPENRGYLEVPTAALPQATISQGGFLFPFEGTHQLTQNISGAYLSDGTFFRSHFGNEIDVGGQFDILAPKDGVVVYADDSSGNSGNCSDASAATNYLVLGHGRYANGKYASYTLYYHLAQGSIPDYLQVAGPNIRVKTGEKIATTGHTGYSTGNHLHFSVSTEAVTFNSNAQVKPCSNGSSNYTNTYTRGFPSISSANSIAVGFEENANNWPLLGGNTATGTLPNSWNRVGLNPNFCDQNHSDNAVIVYKHRDYGGECLILNSGSQGNFATGWDNSISSALVGSLYTLQLYDGQNFIPPVRNIEADTSNFSFTDAYWHDKASSYKVVFGCVLPTSHGEINPLCSIPTTTTPPPTQPPTTTPPPGTVDGLKLISVSSPTVQKGQTFPVSITYEVVSGQLLESRGDHLFGTDPTYGAWPVQAVRGTYNPGQQITFSFNLTSPQQTGTFESRWQMKIGGNLKGQQAIVRFTVQDAPQPPSGGPAGYTWCADEDGTCNFNGIADVAYGSNGQFYYRTGVYSSIGCNNNVFGDPINGTRKACYYKITSGGTGVWTAGFYDTVDRWWDNNNSGNYRCSETINSQFLDVNYGTGTRCGMDPDTWIGEYTTSVNFPSGNYVFYVEHDDGLKLWINGQNVADRGGSGSTYVCPPRSLGGATQLKVMLREDGGDAKVKVSWSTNTSLCTPPQPDLVPYNRDGASQPVIASLTSGNRNQDTLIAGQNAYFDWGFKNIGSGNAGPHHVKLWINGQQYIDYPFSGLGAGYLGGFDDWGITYPNAGCYTVTLTVDTGSQLDESNEGNNSWSGTMCWNPPPQPDLIPYPRDGADQPVVASLYSDWPYQDTLLTGQDAYFYWGFKNIGPTNINSPYHVTVAIDERIFIDYPFSALGAGGLGGFDNWMHGKYDQNLTPGPHQVKIVVDSQNQIVESNENNNIWTGTMYWRAPTVRIIDIYTTDENGTAAGLDASGAQAKESQAAAYKTEFNPGDPIRLYFDIENDFPTDQVITKEWEVTNPAGDIVPELSWTETTLTGTYVWWWYIGRIIPDYLVRGEYTFTGRVTYNGTTTVQSMPFTISGPPSIEAFDTFVTDGNGLSAASLETGPLSATEEASAKMIATNFDAGDPIQLYIQTYNDIADNEPAFFDWSVYDPLGRYVKEMSWSGELNSYAGWSWWWLPTTVPAHAITGEYTFEGSITHGGRTTYSTTIFHITGTMSAPQNDNFGSPVTVNNMPSNKYQDTWTATSALTDPTPSCGYGKNSNSVWYKYTAPASGTLHIDTFGSDYDTVVTLWTGSMTSLVEKGCNDDSYGELQSWLEIPVNAGTIYYIEVMDYGYSGGGDLWLNFDFAQPASNDDFGNSTLINAYSFSNNRDTRGGTRASDDPDLTSCNRFAGQSSIWYRFVPNASGVINLDTRGSDYDTMLAIWTGSRGGLSSVACNDDIGNVDGNWDSDSELTMVQLSAGTTYYIEVSQYNGMIDIDGAEAEGFGKPNAWAEQSGKIDGNEAEIENLEKPDIDAQFWGGQLQLHTEFFAYPATPTLSSPNNESTLGRSEPVTLSFNPVNGVSQYYVEFWGGPSININSDWMSETSWSLGSQWGGVYYWRVKARNAVGLESNWSPTQTLTIKLGTPSNFSANLVSESQAKLSWDASADAPGNITGYKIFKNGSLLGTNDSMTTELTLDISCGMQNNFTVQAYKGDLISDISRTGLELKCPSPVPVSPVQDEQLLLLQPTLDWNDMPGMELYLVQISEYEDFSRILQEEWTDTSNYTPLEDLPPHTTLYWRVRVGRENGLNLWSDIHSFTTPNPPSIPVLISPNSASVTMDHMPLFKWNQVIVPRGTDFSHYQIQVSTDQTFATLTIDENISGLFAKMYSPELGLNSNTTYYWRMRAFNTNNEASSWTEIRSFTTPRPVTSTRPGIASGDLTIQMPETLAPVAEQNVDNLQPVLDWKDVPGATSYIVQVATDQAFSPSAVVASATTIDSQYILIQEIPTNTMLYWRVLAIGTDRWSQWSEVTEFSIPLKGRSEIQ